MTQEEILTYNKRCAEFLGWRYEDKIWLKLHPKKGNMWIVASYSKTFVNFCYDWNWIMEVVESIEKLGETSTRYGTLLDITTTHIRIGKIVIDLKLTPMNKQEAVVQAINEFLIWYNNENNK